MKILKWLAGFFGVDTVTLRKEQEQPMFDEIAFNKKRREFVETEFISIFHDQIFRILREFNPDGKEWILDVLRKANNVGKLDEAIRLIHQSYEDHWACKPPEIRGSCHTTQDVGHVRMIYEKLDIPLPAKKKNPLTLV